jgi:hypothetical protein
MKERIYELWNENPLKVIMWLAIITRLVAAIFSKGFGMHDDHFLIIEPAQSWVDGFDHDDWLPWNQAEGEERAYNFFYVGIMYLILLFLKTAGITNPQTVMFIVRLLHGAFSITTVYLGYKITEKLSDKKSAGTVGLILAVLWLIPFVSVRNLVEVVCIPFLMYGTWLFVKEHHAKNILSYALLSGFIIGIAFSVRYQTILFAGGLGLSLLILKRWKEAIIYGVGFFTSVALIQGGLDLFMYSEPFKALQAYIDYNMIHSHDYFIMPWYNYILLILGILIPPVSIFIFYGFLRIWKKHVLIFLPTMVFFAFHSYFPNKQERFILPILAFIIILGIIGWNEYIKKSGFWQKHTKFIRGSWIFFWVLNLLLLPIISTTYSKKAKVEAMMYLSRYENIHTIMYNSHRAYSNVMCPRSYLGQWVKERCITSDLPKEKLKSKVILDKTYQPRFILFFEENDLDKRIEEVKEMYPNIIFEKKFEPGFIDKVMHWLNPINANETIIIYRNTDLIPESLN